MKMLTAPMALLFTLLAAATCAQEAPAVSSPVVSTNGLQVQLQIQRTNLTIGEPLVLLVALENPEDGVGPVQFSSRMQLPEGNDLEVQIQAEGELETRQSGALEPAVYSATIIEVDPGAKYQHVIPLYYNGSNPTGYVFHKAGQYRVRASLRFSSRTRTDVATAELPPTFIKVTAPTGAAAEAYAQLATPAIAKAFQLGTTSDAALITKLRSVGERYPQTSYGREALRTAILSEAYSEKADLRQILPKLQKYQDLYPQELMTDQVVYTIVAAHNTLQQTDLAREWFFYLLNAYPQSTFIRKHDQIYIYYYKAPANATKGQPWYLMERPWEVPGAKLPVAFQQVAESQ